MYLPLANIGPNLVFNDLNKDGLHDEGEPALEGVAVSLVCDGAEVDSTTTNATGWYEFNDIQPGTCHVAVAPEVDGNDNYVFSPVVEDGNQIYQNGTSPTIAIGYDDIIHGWDAGLYLPLATIGPNTVFNDVDEDGTQDEGEEPVVGVPITLVCDRNAVANTTSDAEGQYEFTNVLPGDCSIQVMPDPDYTFSPVITGGNQIDPDGNSPTVTIGYNDTINTWDVGVYLPPATVGPNVVFDDWDGDGERDPNEPPMENVTVELYCYQDGEAVLIGTNVTDANGEYVFHDVLPGQCYISVTPPAPYVFSPVNPIGNQIYPNGTSPIVDIDWNDNVDDWDVGMYTPVTLGNKVWDDHNGNGFQDEGEPGMVGVLVTLLDVNVDAVMDAATGQAVVTITAADGSYWFTNLAPGEYGVQFALPPDFLFAPAPGDLPGDSMPDGSFPDIAADITLHDNLGVTSTQALTSGENNTSFDAGIYIPVIVDGMVWDDLNANGNQDEGEEPLDGAIITVFNSLFGLSDPNPSFATSNSDGEYTFSLPPGTYFGIISAPSPDYVLSPMAPEKEVNGSDFNPETMQSKPVTLTSGQSGDFDAGFYEPVTIDSYVWDDVDADGIQDVGTEGGYSGPMAVKLYDTNGDPVMETTTNTADGSFKFENVVPGTYEIEFVPGNAGVAFTFQDVGSDDSKDSDVDPSTGRASLTVVSGDYITDIAAGVTSLPSIGPNRIFQDDDADGVLDENEVGLVGVAVVLYHEDGTEAGVFITDENGDYSFTNLQPGPYYISVNNDPSFVLSPVVTGGNQVSPNDGPYSNSSPIVNLSLGDNDNTLLVGMFERVTVGNRVWNDVNGNGVQDADEPGMEGVAVKLIDGSSESQVGIDGITDANGIYLFDDNLAPGSYKVAFVLPNSYVFTVFAKDITPITNPVDGSLDYDHVTSDVDRDTVIGNVGVTDAKLVESGDDNLSFDAGMFIPVTVNGTTWHDLNANGIEDEGELGLTGITVTLYDRDGDVAGVQDTDADGVWHFDDMPPGTYSVEITKPVGSMFEISPKPANNTDGSDFDPESWKTDEVLLLPGIIGDGLFDAGLYLPATIGDRVWFDENPNGIQDGDELPFDQPVTITLYDELGYVIDETESSAETGLYQFTGVRPGTYTLEFILPDEDNQFTLPRMGNDTNLDSDVSPTTGKASVTVTSGEEKLDVDAGVMDYGPYYPDWTNDVLVCTNDGFDPSWLEDQEVNYLYENKEDCCKIHFWWRMNQCMANEEFKFYQDGEICDTKIIFEDWEDNSPTEWTATTQFNTLEECCANEFWYDYDGCVARSPVIFKFEFCVDIQGLVDPQDCQSADVYGNVIEDAVNDGCDHHHGLSESDVHDENVRMRLVIHDDPTSADANITKIGGVSLSKIDGSTVCGGSLGGQGFINELTGTVPDIEAAEATTVNVCGVITVEEGECLDEACLNEHYQELVHELEEFVNNGDLTLAINRRAERRLPPVPELRGVTALPFSLTTQNLLLPATITGDLNLQFYQGSDLTTCTAKSVFQDFEHPYDSLHTCCEKEFSWAINKCCADGGGCPEIGVAAEEEVTDDNGDVVRFFPTWITGKLCESRTSAFVGETSFATLAECCNQHFPRDQDCMNTTG
mmetsp:Transcript_32451/g.58651  ORF Transcript_32451/g.58651 Transcript_32451/m.58651 type:complete len:1622 (-) Transcript_32451:91-4956(-)